MCACLAGCPCSGRWPGGGVTDAAGHVFLDLDPQLFEVVLNWLRQFNISRGGNIHEPEVPRDKLEHMVVRWGAGVMYTGLNLCSRVQGLG